MSVRPLQLSLPGSGHPFVRSVRTQWRELTGGSGVRDEDRRTLIACSGGADSAGLALALADRPVVIAHVVHDLRDCACDDRDVVRALADALRVPFVEAEVQVRELPGNVEANASRARYAALVELADEMGVRFIATGHHADDQLETLLLRIARGSGVTGLCGIAPVRVMDGVSVVRPMLGVTRAQCRSFCTECGFEWCEDETNSDLTRARASIRKNVLPALLEVEPRAMLGAQRTSAQMRLVAQVLEVEQKRILARAERSSGRWSWVRSDLAGEELILIGAALRAAAGNLMGGEGSDQRGSDTVLAAARLIQDERAEAKTLDWRGLKLTVGKDTVWIEKDGHE